MCGICGQYNFKAPQPVDPEVIKRMTRTLVHRGPDDEGYYLFGPVGLGFRRLSIIDLAGGHQPMSDQDESVWIVFNGEIYNFPELRRELEGQGHVFRTRCDTEVIIYGYKQWGLDVFNHLNGMFGLAIWDDAKARLILARDPMGIKFVYYKLEQNRLFFGSEIRPILAAQADKPHVDCEALNLFLRYRYTPSPLTMFKGIKKLAPGTMLIVENGTSRLERWYNFKPEPFSPMPKINQAKEELFDIYKKAVKRHLISDVPVGLLLSGGVDSGLLLGLMNLYGNSWSTYTVGYGSGFMDDELKDASDTAAVFASKHTSVELNRSTFEETLPKIIAGLEEPVATSSIVPMYFVCKRAREDLKVALIGQGPDELFGGYKRHIGVRYGAYFRNLPHMMQDLIRLTINAMPRNETLKRAAYSLNIDDRMRRYQNVFSILPADSIDNLFQEGLLEANAGDKVLDYWSDLQNLMQATDELGGFQFLEIRSSLPDELLMFADKMSMAHSLEVRVPYLDKEIVEYVERLRASYKVKNGKGKRLHRLVCRDFLPKTILNRKKRGFATNIVDEWFRSSLDTQVKSYIRDGQSMMYNYLSYNKVARLLDAHVSGKDDNYKILFSIVSFEQWLRTFV
jgi:asparagine synthase (glutamine-hydrolysing)